MNTCAGCGARDIDGDVCDWRCADEADREKKWRDKEPCEKCMETCDPKDWDPATHGDLCEWHEDARNEAAFERQQESYYADTSGPTQHEQYMEAWKLKRSLR